MATVYEVQKLYDKALEYYQRAYDFYRITNKQYLQMGCKANIANVYELQKNYTKALAAIKNALQLATTTRDSAYMRAKMGIILAYLKQYKAGLEYEFFSLAALEKSAPNDLNAKSFVWGNIGYIYEKVRNLKKSISAFNKVNNIWKPVSDSWAQKNRGQCLITIATIYLKMSKGKSDKKYNSNVTIAMAYLKKGYMIASKFHSKELLRDYYSCLSEAQSQLGQFYNALLNFKRFAAYQDSVNQELKIDDMHSHELSYYTSKQQEYVDKVNGRLALTEKQNELLKERQKFQEEHRRKLSLYYILVFLFLAIGVVFAFFRGRIKRLNFKNELEKEKADKEIKIIEHLNELNELTLSSIRSQMNPHFIFNALNTIQCHIYTSEKEIASEILLKFSSLIRDILENSTKKVITLAKELETLRLYIDIEKERFGESFKAVIEIDEVIDTDSILIPPMLIQPYVENSIKHGLLHVKREKNLLVKVSESIDKVYILATIDDNGVGRKTSMELNRLRPLDHQSFANNANEKRLLLLIEQTN